MKNRQMYEERSSANSASHSSLASFARDVINGLHDVKW